MPPVLVLAVRNQAIFDTEGYAPSCPYRMYVHPLSNVHNQLHVGIVVIVRASRDL